LDDLILQTPQALEAAFGASSMALAKLPTIPRIDSIYERHSPPGSVVEQLSPRSGSFVDGSFVEALSPGGGPGASSGRRHAMALAVAAAEAAAAGRGPGRSPRGSSAAQDEEPGGVLHVGASPFRGPFDELEREWIAPVIVVGDAEQGGMQAIDSPGGGCVQVLRRPPPISEDQTEERALQTLGRPVVYESASGGIAIAERAACADQLATALSQQLVPAERVPSVDAVVSVEVPAIHKVAPSPPVLQRGEDLGQAYLRCCREHMQHLQLTGAPSGEAHFNMARCLSLGTAALRADPPRPGGRAIGLPPCLEGASEEALAEARLDLAAEQVRSAALAGFVDADRALADEDLEALRVGRPRHFEAALRRMHGQPEDLVLFEEPQISNIVDVRAVEKKARGRRAAGSSARGSGEGVANDEEGAAASSSGSSASSSSGEESDGEGSEEGSGSSSSSADDGEPGSDGQEGRAAEKKKKNKSAGREEQGEDETFEFSWTSLTASLRRTFGWGR